VKLTYESRGWGIGVVHFGGANKLIKEKQGLQVKGVELVDGVCSGKRDMQGWRRLGQCMGMHGDWVGAQPGNS
jgi:hypothetical protein